MDIQLQNSVLSPEFNPLQLPDEKKKQLIETHIHVHYEKRSELDSLTVSVAPLAEVDQRYIVNLKLKESGLYTPAKESEILLPAGINERAGEERLTFGFCGNKEEREKAEAVFKELTKEINLLNLKFCKLSDLIEVFFCRNIVPASKMIRLGCYSNQFRYIINFLRSWRFDSLNLTNIEKSRIFYSKDNNIITRNLLSSTTQRNMNKPKRVETIDAILKQLH